MSMTSDVDISMKLHTIFSLLSRHLASSDFVPVQHQALSSRPQFIRSGHIINPAVVSERPNQLNHCLPTYKLL